MRASIIRGKIKEKELTQETLAEMLGMSANSLSRKLNGKREFTISEASAVSEILGIENPNDVFFAQTPKYATSKEVS